MKYSAESVRRSGIGALIIASLVLLPTLALAKEKENKKEWKEERKEQLENWREERKEQREQWKEFNRGFFENGWFKDRGLHLGWYKKWWKHSSTTPSNDTTAPQISDIETTARARSAIITWDTNERSDSKVYYSTNSSVNIDSDSTKKAVSKAWVMDHEISIGGLSATTTYYAFVVSTDPRGNAATSSVFSFTTKGTNPDTRAPRIMDVSTDVGTSTITIEWETDEPATSKVYYATPDLTSTSSASVIENTSLVTDHSVTITGLNDDTDYHFRIESRDAAGNVRLGNEFSLETDED